MASDLSHCPWRLKTHVLGTKLSLTARKAFPGPRTTLAQGSVTLKHGPVQVCAWSPGKGLELGVWEGPWPDGPQLSQQAQAVLTKAADAALPTVIRGPFVQPPCLLVFISGSLTDESNSF